MSTATAGNVIRDAEAQKLKAEIERLERLNAAARHFSSVFIPAWFNVLGWILVIAAFRFAAIKSGDIVVSFVAWISLTFLAYHVLGKFVQIQLPGTLQGKTVWASRIIWLLLFAPIAIVLNLLVNHLAIVVANFL